MTEKHCLATLDTTRVQMNASILARVLSRGPYSLVVHGVIYKETSANTIQICSHACVSIAVVTSLGKL